MSMDISPTAYEELRLELNQAKRRLDELERQVSLLEDCAELDKQPEPQPDGFNAWWEKDVSSELLCDDPYVIAQDAWNACADSLKSKHDAELVRAFVQGSNWEYDRAGSEDPSERAKGMLAAGTLGKP